MTKAVLIVLVVGAALAVTILQPRRPAHVVRRYQAPEATQAVAVDAAFFYAIGNAVIGKYEKATGRRVAVWAGKPDGPIAHLNSGIVLGETLYAAHSNYPETPMVSSVEVFDTVRMAHVRSLPLPSELGSATWVERRGRRDRNDNDWWVTFAHYAGRGGVPGKGPEHTTLVRFDAEWRRQQSWSFPRAVVSRWDGMSSSGGVWLNETQLVTTGHHAPELYLLEVPASPRPQPKAGRADTELI